MLLLFTFCLLFFLTKIVVNIVNIMKYFHIQVIFQGINAIHQLFTNMNVEDFQTISVTVIRIPALFRKKLIIDTCQ